MICAKHTLLCLLLTAVLAGGCGGVTKQGPAMPALPLDQAKAKLEEKKTEAKNMLPTSLGGVVQSDRWLIHKELEQEEFIGHVAYDSPTYRFRSDYALSDRKKSTLSAQGNVRLKYTAKEGPSYAARAQKGHYNYQTELGALYGTTKAPVEIEFTDDKGQLTNAWAERATFNLKTRMYHLHGNARVQRPTEQGLVTLSAQQIEADETNQKAILDGAAQLSTQEHRLNAKTIIFDAKNNKSYAHGQRPLMQGQTQDGTFAIIADNAEAENESKKIIMKGQVQGWVVSDQLNSAGANSPI